MPSFHQQRNCSLDHYLGLASHITVMKPCVNTRTCSIHVTIAPQERPDCLEWICKASQQCRFRNQRFYCEQYMYTHFYRPCTHLVGKPYFLGCILGIMTTVEGLMHPNPRTHYRVGIYRSQWQSKTNELLDVATHFMHEHLVERASRSTWSLCALDI